MVVAIVNCARVPVPDESCANVAAGDFDIGEVAAVFVYGAGCGVTDECKVSVVYQVCQARVGLVCEAFRIFIVRVGDFRGVDTDEANPVAIVALKGVSVDGDIAGRRCARCETTEAQPEEDRPKASPKTLYSRATAAALYVY